MCRLTLALGTIIALAAAGCTDSGVPLVRGRPPEAGAPDRATEREASAPDATLDRAASDASDATRPDASLSPVRLGILPELRPGADATPRSRRLADIEVLAAGSRAVSILRRWDDLFVDASTSNASAWAELAERAALFRGAGVAILFSIAVVDRTADARPPGVAGWDSEDAFRAIERVVDATFATFGTELAYLTFGTELDRWLVRAPSSEQGALESFTEYAMSYARSHARRPSGAAVGATLSASAVTLPQLPEVAALRDAGDVTVATYFPLARDFSARPPDVVAEDIDALSETSSDDAGARAIVLEQVGYPSAPEAGSSAEAQREFYENLFGALGARRQDIRFSTLAVLNDPSSDACERDAAAMGAAASPVALAGRCSIGLREADGSPKPAWSAALRGLAELATP